MAVAASGVAAGAVALYFTRSVGMGSATEPRAAGRGRRRIQKPRARSRPRMVRRGANATSGAAPPASVPEPEAPVANEAERSLRLPDAQLRREREQLCSRVRQEFSQSHPGLAGLSQAARQASPGGQATHAVGHAQQQRSVGAESGADSELLSQRPSSPLSSSPSAAAAATDVPPRRFATPPAPARTPPGSPALRSPRRSSAGGARRSTEDEDETSGRWASPPGALVLSATGGLPRGAVPAEHRSGGGGGGGEAPTGRSPRPWDESVMVAVGDATAATIGSPSPAVPELCGFSRRYGGPGGARADSPLGHRPHALSPFEGGGGGRGGDGDGVEEEEEEERRPLAGGGPPLITRSGVSAGDATPLAAAARRSPSPQSSTPPGTAAALGTSPGVACASPGGEGEVARQAGAIFAHFDRDLDGHLNLHETRQLQVSRDME
jgi:hypothetical protein